ncbi:MAG: glycosyltransferase family 4 protein [Elusimicrobia bacterium]|nr:glycosyltransferase family 4 protein [Elusimicrobiota bacterium]
MIVLDARMAGHSGIGTYIRGLLSGFSEEQLRRITLLGDPRQLARIPCALVEARESVYGLGEQIKMPGRIRKLSPALLHVPHYNIPVFYKGKTVATVHDLIHLLFPQFSRTPLARLYARWFLDRVARSSVCVMSDSERTRQDLMRLGAPAEKVRVVPLAIDEVYRPVPPEEARAHWKELNLSPGYILYVGNIRKIKNVPRLLKAYILLRHKFPDCPPLVLVGRDQIPEDTAPYRENRSIRFLGEVKRESLPALYSGAAFFAFPSLYEGFGLPPLEAMACGCPVVSSTGGSLPEVLGGAALLVDPVDTEALAETMGKALADDALRRDLRARGLEHVRRYSWKNTAQKVFQIYEEAIRQ